ncbi:hypothetical protein A3C89_00740 [Candidatus Kaiserbacteria bacterium RIFCSPHIGHO2_02_FULL_50_50]|uniref:Uncharacterized protein n=1 Tax=Candidatus Kaiserbacteria bacterium RIFCSPHIGHO2_02_FULL_50_50 TaxID=1798492 RepID=A0A1F6DFR8_9BACT|nr:MAG: hypothetical protein A3C89_00740 [Candidatus Kaiserbacteria bacterium RIFCSPHIGHO2_02_FULL_50_50]OGG88877.1 MAG: hypothetical protein A3G62_03180 [Candidatus Kaiserbacteria bacterium RIFCSPLOWO2_12_FULL_50_10]
MKVLDQGHIYELRELGGGTCELKFVKRSGGAIQYSEEWGGVQTQEVLRACIDRTKYLFEVLPCNETADALYHLRMALYCYEARAHRRKHEAVNRKRSSHNDVASPNAHRDGEQDVPFTEHEIELLPTGDDGHIMV